MRMTTTPCLRLPTPLLRLTTPCLYVITPCLCVIITVLVQSHPFSPYGHQTRSLNVSHFVGALERAQEAGPWAQKQGDHDREAASHASVYARRVDTRLTHVDSACRAL